MTTTIPDGTNRPTTTAAPMPQGWVVETIIEGRMAWMVKPEPLKPYTFTHDLARAHVFEREGEARDSRASVWCWHDRHGQHPSLEVVWFSDTYRAKVAACVLADSNSPDVLAIDPQSDAARLARHRDLHRTVHPDVAAAARAQQEALCLLTHQRNEAVAHLHALLNQRRTATQMLEAERAAREWLVSIGSEPG